MLAKGFIYNCFNYSRISLLFFFCLNSAIISRAQVSSDNTLAKPTRIFSPDGNNFIITGGTKVGDQNLFHSFRVFTVPRSGSVVFQNPNVENIISRVTGNNISTINGLIQANANLFFINPNGITFRSGAQLDISGSFIASTASRINFADGSSFGIDISTPPLLTVNVPDGLQLGAEAGQIRIMGGFLEGQMGTTIAILGNGIRLMGRGGVFIPSGRVELGSVASSTNVRLDTVPEGFTFVFDHIQDFHDIDFSQGSFIDTSGDFAGPVRLHGREISFANFSGIEAFNELENSPGANIYIKAIESVILNSSSSINIGDGNEGLVSVDTKTLILRDNSFIDASTVFSGRDGSIVIRASELVELEGGSGLLSFTFGDSTGNIVVHTGKLRLLDDDSQINTTTAGGAFGNSGDIEVEATESIDVVGQAFIFSGTTNSETTGNGGSIKIRTKRLSVKDGGTISVASIDGSQGQAGSIDIVSTNEVLISGLESTLVAESESSNPAGNLTISTDNFTIQNGAQVSVSATGDGDSGSLFIDAGIIQLNNQGALIADTNATEGNIELRANGISLLNNSTITTNAEQAASGGNIIINSGVIFAQGNSDITANATEGSGGLVDITAQLAIGLTERTFADFEGIPADPALLETSDVTAFSQLGGPSLAGTILFQTPETDPSDGLINLPVNVVDASRLVAQSCLPNRNSTASDLSKLIITRRGGIPANPIEDIENNSVQTNWVVRNLQPPAQQQSSATDHETITLASAQTSPPIVEAQGWEMMPDGRLMLTAKSQTPSTQIAGVSGPNCTES